MQRPPSPGAALRGRATVRHRWEPLQPKHTHQCPETGERGRQSSRGAASMNIERSVSLGRPRRPLPELGTVCTPRRAPTVERGARDSGWPCPVLATKRRPCCQKYSPLSLTASPFSRPGLAPQPEPGMPRVGAVPGPGGTEGTVTHPDREGSGPAEPELSPTQPWQQFCPALQTSPGGSGLSLPSRSGSNRAQGAGSGFGPGRGCPSGRRSRGLHKSLFSDSRNSLTRE